MLLRAQQLVKTIASEQASHTGRPCWQLIKRRNHCGAQRRLRQSHVSLFALRHGFADANRTGGGWVR